MKNLHLILTCLLSMLMCGNLFAQWPDDPAQNLVICNRTGEQTIPKVAATFDGGCFVGWYDNSSGNYDLYLQRLDGDGVIQWTTNGLLVSNHPQNSWLTDWDMTVDHADHCILAFNDIRSGGDWDIYAYRISTTGEFVWGADGIAISANNGFEPDPRVIATSGGNIAFAWQEETVDGNVVNLRKLTPAGTDVYTAGTITIAAQFGLSIPRIAASGNDAVLLQYLVHTGSEFWRPRHIYMQKYDSLGNELWFEDATAVMTTDGIGIQMKPDIVSDGAGGAYSFWYDSRNSELHAYAQRVLATGVTAWTENGVLADESQGELQMSPSATVLDAGLALFYQSANPSQSQWGAQGQLISVDGSRLWTSSGKVIEPLAAEQAYNLFAHDQNGNATVVYKRTAPGGGVNTLVHAAAVAPNGEFFWEDSVVDLCTVESDKNHLAATINPAWQVIAVWPDNRIESGDIYLQNVNPDGSLGPPTPQPVIDILSPAQDTTVHNNFIELQFDVENFELGVDGVIYIEANIGIETFTDHTTSTSYTLPLTQEGEWLITALLRPSPEEPVIPGTGDFVRVTYAAPSITINSPSSANDTVHVGNTVNLSFTVDNFEVANGTGDGAIVMTSDGETSVIYSTNSILLAIVGEGIHEIRLELVDNDIQTLDPAVFDIVWLDNRTDATDENIFSPTSFALHPAYPNPFNPETTIQFDVKQTAYVRLTVHDILGREVAALVGDTYDTGRYSISWNASDISSGVYFVRMQAGEFTATQKLMLLK